ncbi:GNAT family N-acetyltransferase [Nocardioides panacis]|uniref:GNAT family N-acetyltransferase n=1 Tax=Nocardioides panacis TaxID=2849501 RepID=A0A975SWF1_9ACTN|nr:GNAT family N-acetyltransferase [Nocardioides panacis]QWZ06588.1 GNAT family N-acetyltransferase [Nocardioides panacis]
MTTTLELHADAAGFLAQAADHLGLDPVLNTVVATHAEREAREGRTADEGLPHWYAVARAADGSVAGVAMRTAPFAPYPPYLLPMPEDAAVGLARLLHERGERVGGVNGALPAARTFADELARLAGGVVTVRMHTRLFEARAVRVPPTPGGALRVATEPDADLALAWFSAFHADADAQAGRSAGHAEEPVTADTVLGRLRAGLLFVWEVDGVPVHLTGQNPPSYGAVRIGPVYTPRAHRGRGYAGAAVAELSRRALADRLRPCLFTDQANPVSNGVYERVGYEPVADMVSLLVGDPVPDP